MPNHKSKLDKFSTFPKINDPLATSRFLEGVLNQVLFQKGDLNPDLQNFFDKNLSRKEIKERFINEISFKVEVTPKLDGENIGLVYDKEAYKKFVTKARNGLPEDPFYKEYIASQEKMELFNIIHKGICAISKEDDPELELDRVLISGEYCHDTKKTLVEGFFIHTIKAEANNKEIYCDLEKIYEELCHGAFFSEKKVNSAGIYFMRQFYVEHLLIKPSFLKDIQNFNSSGEQKDLKEEAKPLYGKLDDMKHCPVVKALSGDYDIPPSEGFVMQLIGCDFSDKPELQKTVNKLLKENVNLHSPIGKIKFEQNKDLEVRKLNTIRNYDTTLTEENAKSEREEKQLNEFIAATFPDARINKIKDYVKSNFMFREDAIIKWTIDDLKEELKLNKLFKGWISKNFEILTSKLEEKIKEIIQPILTLKNSLPKASPLESVQKNGAKNNSLFFKPDISEHSPKEELEQSIKEEYSKKFV